MEKQKRPHFIAQLKYLTTDEGGRNTFAVSGYRPTIKFPFYDGMFSGIQNLIGKDRVEPGECIYAEITLLDTEYFKGKLLEGMEFKFYEGNRLIGDGKIDKIVHLELINASR